MTGLKFGLSQPDTPPEAAPPRRGRSLSRSRVGLALLVVVQLAFALFFLWDMLTSLLLIPTRPLSWELREMVEVGAAIGLIAGVFLGAYTFWQLVGERNRAETARALAEMRLRRASSAFHALLEERFTEWELTPAERDVALFALKGLSLAQIAQLRDTSEGTVKTQTNAIYRKAGVSGRPQFLSLFIEDLLMANTGHAPRVPAAPPTAAVAAG